MSNVTTPGFSSGEVRKYISSWIKRKETKAIKAPGMGVMEGKKNQDEKYVNNVRLLKEEENLSIYKVVAWMLVRVGKPPRN